MTFSISIEKNKLGTFSQKIENIIGEKFLLVSSFILSLVSIIYSYRMNIIVAYGDAESHLNIAKRIISSLTPGLAQLGGIWLPLPHLLLTPLVYFDFLWRSGLAGSIISGITYIITSIYIYKTAYLTTNNKIGSMVASIFFMTNLNILYMQSTPMTEIPLICFLVLSLYYFVSYIKEEKLINLIYASFFGLLASLSRYDGWFFVIMQAAILFLRRFPFSKFRENLRKRGLTLFPFFTEKSEGELILYSTIGFVGILIWIIWGFLILGDPFYFTNSEFSAKSQQNGFLARGQLPTYHNLILSILYYTVTSSTIAGLFIFAITAIAWILFLKDKNIKHRYLISILLFSPFLFNVVTMYLGQSVIFIPSLTPADFEWQLFNVRYGLLMIPAVAILCGYFFVKTHRLGKTVLTGVFISYFFLNSVGYSRPLAMTDGTSGLSKGSHPGAEIWLRDNYDSGLLLLDDYARTLSIIGSGVPMQNVVYLGNRGYWEKSLTSPQDVVRWIVMQKDDTVWNKLYKDKNMQGVVFKYYNKVYTSDTILIFRKI